MCTKKMPVFKSFMKENPFIPWQVMPPFGHFLAYLLESDSQEFRSDSDQYTIFTMGTLPILHWFTVWFWITPPLQPSFPKMNIKPQQTQYAK